MKKWLLGAVSAVVGATTGVVAATSVANKEIEERSRRIDKFKSYYGILLQWLQLKQKGVAIDQYFIEHEYQTIAIYGMGEIGNCLYEELKETNVKVAYAIDKNADATFSEITVYGMEEKLPKVDLIVVTATFAFDEVYEALREKTDAEILSIEDVVFGLS